MMQDHMMTVIELPIDTVPSGLSQPACKGVVNQINDNWRDDGQCTIRVHTEPRRNLFRPFQSRGAPKMSLLTSTRVTHVTYVDNGETFLRQDKWTCKTPTDVDLGRYWVGRIVFMPQMNIAVATTCHALNSVTRNSEFSAS